MSAAAPYDVAEADYLVDKFDPTRGFDWRARHMLPSPAGCIFRVPDSEIDGTPLFQLDVKRFEIHQFT